MRMIKSKQRVTYGNYDQSCSYPLTPIETYLPSNFNINFRMPSFKLEDVYYIVKIVDRLVTTFTKLFKYV